MKITTVKKLKQRLSYFIENKIDIKSYEIAYQGKHVPQEAPSLTNYYKLNGSIKNNNII